MAVTCEAKCPACRIRQIDTTDFFVTCVAGPNGALRVGILPNVKGEQKADEKLLENFTCWFPDKKVKLAESKLTGGK